MGIGNQIVIIIAGVLLVSLLQVALLWVSLKRKRDERILFEKLEELLRLQKEFKQNNVEILKLRVNDITGGEPDTRQSIIELYQKKLMLCKAEFNKSEACDILSDIRFNNAKTLSETERKTILDSISKSFVEIIQDMYIEIPDIKSTDIDTCILSYLGCDNDAISQIECVSAAAIRQRKSRLAKKAPEDLFELFVPTAQQTSQI